MSPADLKALRQELGCTARDLAAALGLDQQTVLAWERGDLFPTKKHVDRMAELRKLGPGAIPKQRPARRADSSPMAVLADPELWRLVRKLLAHPELRAAAIELASRYEDPADG